MKTTYEALNTQLLEELPKFLEMGSKIYCHCVTEFILLRKLFVGRVTKELLSLMDVSTLMLSHHLCPHITFRVICNIN